ncbi:hypothetical protein [Lentzea sp.]|uniref:hypothetical protein n=1 Tax=Lentzea sp. TaxID=56099 RepID=UPI002C1D0D0F|nr:hypothetical protein [Lentzea sp.]HUQ54892.1 hypothetical protein [Lentzea sp.]
MAGEVAEALDADLDVVVARKIGAPNHPEYGVGAVTADNAPFYDQNVLRALNLTEEQLTRTCDDKRAEARRRTAPYRGGKPLRTKNRDVILVPRHFRAVSRWYESFDQTTDDEVLRALE